MIILRFFPVEMVQEQRSIVFHEVSRSSVVSYNNRTPIKTTTIITREESNQRCSTFHRSVIVVTLVVVYDHGVHVLGEGADLSVHCATFHHLRHQRFVAVLPVAVNQRSRSVFFQLRAPKMKLALLQRASLKAASKKELDSPNSDDSA